MKKYILSIILFTAALFAGLPVLAEGSGNWKGSQTNRQSSLYVPSFTTGNTGYNTRGFMMLPSTRSEQNAYNNAYDPGHRFYVYVKAGETVYFSFRHASGSARAFNWYYDATTDGVNEKFPAGKSEDSRTVVTSANSGLTGNTSTNGNLSQTQATQGPRPVAGGNSGYEINNSNGGSFTNNSGSDRAFWLEFTSTSGFEITDWDVTVVNNSTSNIAQPGRVYSKYWSILNGLPNSAGNVSNSSFHDDFGFYVPVENTYTAEDDDYYIKYVNFGRSNAGYAVFFANDSGPLNNTLPGGQPDIEGNRKSITGTSNRFQYPLFVAEPDETIWETTTPPIASTDVRFRRKADATGGEAYFLVEVDTPGSLDILVDLDQSGDYSAGDVQIFEYFESPGEYEVYWDGKDGNGDVVPSGTKIKLLTSANFFPVHFPVYDMEQSLGVRMENVRPTAIGEATVKLFWDHSNIYTGNKNNNNWSGTPPNSVQSPAVNTTGVDGPDNIWWATGDNGIGNNNTMNVYAGSWMETLELEFSFDWDASDIEVIKTVDNDSPLFGSQVTFTIEVVNNGLMFAQDVTVEDLLPSGYTYISHEAPMGKKVTIPDIGSDETEETWADYQTTYEPDTGIWNVKDIPYDSDDLSQNKLTLTIVAEVLTTGEYNNTAEGYPLVKESDPNHENNSSTVVVTPTYAPWVQADNDINQTPVNIPVSGNVLTNDYSSNGILNVGAAEYYDDNGVLQDLPLGTETTICTEEGTEAGKIILNSDGSYTFTPAEDFVGDVPLEYTAINGDTIELSNNSDDARLTIIVIPEAVPGNNPPVAVDDVAATKKGVTLTGDILANDSDPDSDEIFVTDATQGSTTITVGTSTQVSGKDSNGDDVENAGSITINADGKITFVPNGDFVGTVNPIEYTISDGNDGTDTANIYITVIEDRGNTTFANDDSNVAKQDETMTGNVLDNDFDPEGDTQALTKIKIGDNEYTPDGSEIVIPGKGKLTINSNGEYTFVPETEFVGTVVVEQTVCDDGTPVACDNATLYLTTLPESDNTTNAVDDFFETKNNTPVSGNVLENDYDNEGDTQKVTTTGTITTTEGGSVTIDENGNFTYTPPADKNGIFDTFTYTVCDDGTPQACDEAEVTIAVGICYEEVEGKIFKWNEGSGANSPVTNTITQPAADYGFTFDIYELDNSFNMEINGVKLAVDEIEFQSSGTAGINIMFEDGDEYETDTYHGTSKADIWEMRGNKENPLIRVVITYTGKVFMYGSKVSYGPLFPLKFIEDKGNKFNTIDFSNEAGEDNTIVVTQNVVGVTVMDGYGYGRNMVDCPNYWYGYNDSNEWAENSNWTDNYVPGAYEDIEFATDDNNSGIIQGMSGPGAGKGAAKEDLYLDDIDHDNSGGRIINDLINKSEKDLVITTTNQLIIDGKVHDDNTGIIVVKADEDDATGTLIFNDPDNNQNVDALVEFINLADECEDCGFYRRNWQYFGIPVQGGKFLFQDIDGETVRRWDEPTNGDKWLPVTTESMIPFRGYEITSKVTAPKYEFEGKLNVGDQNISLSKTAAVNYSGMNLLSNSYTAAIPISEDAIELNSSLVNNTVYLFNRGTRDQWRKLNGGSVPGTAGGQYTSVPVQVSGMAGLPDRILSMHSFMVEASADNAPVTLKYAGLVKNETNGAGQPAWRSADSNAKRELPYIVLDIIGEGSADRVWLFEESSTTRGFDNGWDGHKILEEGLIQTYVSGSDDDKYQVATVPQIDGTTLSVRAKENESYTISVSAAPDVDARRMYLHDTFTGKGYLIKDGAEIIISGTRSVNQNRFKITASAIPAEMADASLINTYVRDNMIVVENRSNESATVSVYDISGRFVGKAQIAKDEMKSFPELSIASGVMVVKVVSDSNAVNKSDRVLLK